MGRFPTAAIIFVTLVAVVPTATMAGEVVPAGTTGDGLSFDIGAVIAPGGVCDGKIDQECHHFHGATKINCTIYTGASEGGSHMGGSNCFHSDVRGPVPG